MDYVTEIIAHFVGVFNVTVEQERARIDYDSFKAAQKQLDAEAPLQSSDYQLNESHTYRDFDPHVGYNPRTPDLATVDVTWFYDEIYGPDIALSEVGPANPPLWVPSAFSVEFSPAQLEIAITPPGSIAIVAKQKAFLVDNDFVTMTDVHVETLSTDYFDAELEWLVAKADGYDVIGPLAIPASEEAIAEVVDQIIENLAAVADADSAAFVATGSEVQGIHVNGEKVDTLPELSDFLPQDEEPEEIEHGPVTYGPGEIEIEPQMDIDAGGNLIVNEAAIGSSWLDAPVFAAMGDVVSLDVISQVHVRHEIDQVADGLGGPPTSQDLDALGFNIASFSTESNALEATESGFPSDWAVTRIEGNLVLLNWIEQVTMVSDHDVSILTASGAETHLVTGDNTTLNTMSLFELGSYYDLIVVGGDIYSADIVEQSIVLLDSDYLTTIGDFQTTLDDTVMTGDNLVWNEASISDIGATTYAPISAPYVETAENLASGDDTLADGVLMEDAFAGESVLSVLYIDGSILELDYISQTSVLGDADQIAVVASDLTEDADTQWDISTGDNDVVNVASIIDAGVDSIVYYGGELFTDAYLHQAEFVSDEPIALNNDPDALADEAVVFLADGMLDPEAQQEEGVTPTDQLEDPANPDVMQTMLA
ncbi:MAG: hypothetical protein AAF724_08475 [Pseudomonadota bacterium]